MKRIGKWLIFVPALALTICVYIAAAAISVLYLTSYVARDMAKELYAVKGLPK